MTLINKIRNFFIICLLVVSGGLVFCLLCSQKNSQNFSTSINNNNKNTYTEKDKKAQKEILKLKKINDQQYCYKSKWEHGKGGGESEATFSEENFSSIIREHYEREGGDKWEKGVLVNWKSELKDNLWLVKEKKVEANRTIYQTYYENNQGKKIS